MNHFSSKSCIVVTCFSEKQPGYLDFSYRIKSLAKHYNLTILSQDQLTQSELMVPRASYIAMGRQSGKYGWLSYLWKCVSYIRKHKIHVLVLMHSSASPITLLAGNTPTCLYWNEHPTNLVHLPHRFSPIQHFLAVVARGLVFLGARHADLVMPIGEEHYDDLLVHGCKQERVKLIHMGVADEFSGCAVKPEDYSKTLELIYIGTVSAQRGRDVMIDGMAEAVRRGYEVHLTIVGAGDEQLIYCRKRLGQLGIQDSVHILGRVPGNKIPFYLAKADFGICLWEDQPWCRFNPPTKLFEYLAAGLPILASDICTHSRYVESWNNGLIFEYGVSGFANAIGKLITGRGRLPELGSNALESGQMYLWSRIEPTFLDEVDGLISL